tara:strand:+ start:1085 stop:1813 length:729 start_codon:yes stop_codon:yes gene_type:complete
VADIFDDLESKADELAKKIDQSYDEVFAALLQLVDGKTSEEAIEILAGLDIGQALKLKQSAAISRTMASGAVSILENTYTTTAPLTETALRGLLVSVESKLSSRFTDVVGNDMRSIIVDGISTGKFPNQILKESKERLEELGHSAANAKKEIQTGFNQYSNSVTNSMAEKAPANTKYVYIGANDIKTRDACVEKINFGAATRKEIIDRFGDMNNEVWNCRHKWDELSSSPEDQGYNPEKYEE